MSSLAKGKPLFPSVSVLTYCRTGGIPGLETIYEYLELCALGSKTKVVPLPKSQIAYRVSFDFKPGHVVWRPREAPFLS